MLRKAETSFQICDFERHVEEPDLAYQARASWCSQLAEQQPPMALPEACQGVEWQYKGYSLDAGCACGSVIRTLCSSISLRVLLAHTPGN